MDFIKSLFTPEQWVRVMDWLVPTALMLLSNALTVLWVIFLIFGTTQVIKISWRKSKIKGPPEWALHFVSLISAGGWSLLLDNRAADERVAIAVAAWFLTWLIVTYGGALLKEYQPKLWSAINFDRRKLKLGPPPATHERREDEKP